uniref:amino acid transporter heavy chain SLC3A2 n=1 Tax=Myxine glutinosa TaxID=7769 RepID=UPI00358F0E56
MGDKVDMKDVQLHDDVDVEAGEKQAMTGVYNGLDVPGDESAQPPSTTAGPGTVSPTRFTGLTKEQLLKQANEPFWKRTRYALLALFWLAWLAMLVGAIMIIVTAPRCQAPPELTWYEETAVYHVDVRSFLDSDTDGVGDFKGLLSKLEYVKQLQVHALLLSPVHSTELDDADRTYFGTVDGDVGSMEDFGDVLAGATNKDINIILDLTQNYKSSGTKWLRSRDLENDVAVAMEFWMGKGVYGFLITHLEDFNSTKMAKEMLSLWHNKTKDYASGQKQRVLMVSSADGTLADEMVREGLADMAIPRDLTQALKASGNIGPGLLTDVLQNLVPHGDSGLRGWLIGGPGYGHLASVVPDHLSGVLSIFLLTLPGTPFISYGDEIGLQEIENVTWSDVGMAMQWSNSENAGFTNGKSGIPVNPEYATRNVQRFSGLKSNSSLLMYQKLNKLKWNDWSVKYGNLTIVKDTSMLLSYKLVWDRSPRFLVCLNFGDMPSRYNMVGFDMDLPETAVVVTGTHELAGKNILLTELDLGPYEGLVLKYKFEE